MFPKRARSSQLQIHIDYLALEIAESPVAFFTLLCRISTKASAKQLFRVLLRNDYRKVLEQSLYQAAVPEAVRSLIVESLNEVDAKPSILQKVASNITFHVKSSIILTRALLRFVWLVLRTALSALA